jgi:hypothetical protein
MRKRSLDGCTHGVTKQHPAELAACRSRPWLSPKSLETRHAPQGRREPADRACVRSSFRRQCAHAPAARRNRPKRSCRNAANKAWLWEEAASVARRTASTIRLRPSQPRWVVAKEPGVRPGRRTSERFHQSRNHVSGRRSSPASQLSMSVRAMPSRRIRRCRVASDAVRRPEGEIRV